MNPDVSPSKQSLPSPPLQEQNTFTHIFHMNFPGFMQKNILLSNKISARFFFQCTVDTLQFSPWMNDHTNYRYLSCAYGNSEIRSDPVKINPDPRISLNNAVL